MPTLLPSRSPTPKPEYDFSPVLTLVAAALALALVSLEAQILDGNEGISGALSSSKSHVVSRLHDQDQTRASSSREPVRSSSFD
jgi:hypothetical protein